MQPLGVHLSLPLRRRQLLQHQPHRAPICKHLGKLVLQRLRRGRLLPLRLHRVLVLAMLLLLILVHVLLWFNLLIPVHHHLLQTLVSKCFSVLPSLGGFDAI